MCWVTTHAERSGLGLALVIFPQSHLGSRVGLGPAPPGFVTPGNPQEGRDQITPEAMVTGVARTRPVRPVRTRILPMWHRVWRGPGTRDFAGI